MPLTKKTLVKQQPHHVLLRNHSLQIPVGWQKVLVSFLPAKPLGSCCFRLAELFVNR